MLATKALIAAFLVGLSGSAAAQTAPPSGRVIEGVVVDGDTRQGISGARVKLDSDLGGPRFTITDGGGHFRFTGFTEKRYSLAAQQIGYMRPEEGPQSFGGSAWVQIGQEEPARLVLIRYAVVAGTVTDSSGEPVSVAEVNVLRKAPDGKDLETVGHLYTDQRGAFRVARLRPGTYYVRVDGRSGMPLTDAATRRATYYGGALDLSGAKPIEATRGRTYDNINVEILKRAGVRVSGHVVKPTGHGGAASSEEVMTSLWLQPASATSGSSQYALTKDDGFEIKDVLPGKYTLTANMREMYGRPEATNNLAAAIQTIEVQTSDVSGLTVALDAPQDLSGTVHIGEGCTRGKFHLTLMDPMPHNIDVNADGSFVVKDLLPARYRVSGWVDGEQFGRLGTVRLAGRESQDEFIMEGGDFGPLEVEIVCPRGRVSGEVRDPTGAPADTATIALVSNGRPGSDRLVTVNQAGGRFDIPIAPGVYDILACTRSSDAPLYSPDCQKGAEAVTVNDGANLRLVLTLPPAERKAGTQ